MKYIVLISVILIASYKLPKHTINHNFYKYDLNIDTSKYAIFKLEDDPSYFDNTDKPANLSKEEIDQIEKIIDKEIAKINAEYKKSQHSRFNYIGNPQEYYKQMIPVINIKGEKIIWVNCLCTVSNKPDWKTRIIGMLDGGSCFFNCKINLKKNRFYDLIINGVG